MAFLEKVEPPSWVIGDLVREAGNAGILYRSVRNTDFICLALFPALSARFQAPVYDPDGRLLAMIPQVSNWWSRLSMARS